jgi:hypothetical protein
VRRGDIGIEAMVETPGHDERVDAVTQLFGVGGNSFTEELGPEASEESLITPVFTKVSDAHHHPWGATSCRKAASTYVPSDAVGNERLTPTLGLSVLVVGLRSGRRRCGSWARSPCHWGKSSRPTRVYT